MERLLGHREQPIPSLRASRRDVTAALDAAFCRLMAKSPENRLQTMAGVVSELEECRKPATGRPSRPLKAFDDRDAEALEREETYQIARPNPDSSSSRSEVLSTVFVRSRGPSDDRHQRARATRWREGHRLTAAIVVVALVLVLWYFLR
jgi:hypothetical protein